MCRFFEPAKDFPMEFDEFWEPLRTAVVQHCKPNGNLELVLSICESNELSVFRKQFPSQGTFTFEKGIPVSIPNEDEGHSKWMIWAIRSRFGK